MTRQEKQILKGEICPYCKVKSEKANSKEVYHGKDYGDIFICRPCKAYVGVHKDNGKPLGRLANAELRKAKREAHRYFDNIWKLKYKDRKKAYAWLSESIGVEKEFCHIGMFDIEQCLKVVQVCKKFFEEL